MFKEENVYCDAVIPKLCLEVSSICMIILKLYGRK